MNLKQAIEKIGRINPQTALLHAVEQTKDKYIELNEQQMAEGKMNNSDQISPPYSAPYAKKRRKAGLQTSNVDLKFTGALYEGMNVQPNGLKLELGSSVSYEKYVTNRYSQRIWGLDDENMAKYRAIVKPIIQAEIQIQYGL